MLKSMMFPRRIVRVAGIAALTIWPALAQADRIVLTSPDRTVRFEGEFVAFDLTEYVIEIHGIELRIGAAQMRCEGVNCMNFEPIPQSDGNS